MPVTRVHWKLGLPMDVHHFKSLIVLSRRFFLKTLTLRRLKSGQDRISVRMIRKIAIGITPALTKLINPSMQTVSSFYHASLQTLYQFLLRNQNFIMLHIGVT